MYSSKLLNYILAGALLFLATGGCQSPNPLSPAETEQAEQEIDNSCSATVQFYNDGGRCSGSSLGSSTVASSQSTCHELEPFHINSVLVEATSDP